LKIYRLGLTGFPLEHSRSPQIHQAAMEALGLRGEYKLYPLATPAGLVDLCVRLRSGRLHGLNVTIPYKQTVIPLLDRLTPTAQMCGAVNTLVMDGDILVGENTDLPAFINDLQARMGSLTVGTALVLGAGGAARAVAAGLLQSGWKVQVAARRASQAQELCAELQEWTAEGCLSVVDWTPEDLQVGVTQAALLVNATPAGMYPLTESDPLPVDVQLSTGLCVYDLIYNPLETCLLQRARANGNRTAHGLGMLVEQAALAFERWTGTVAPRKAMRAAGWGNEIA
jgi:shikimate dehydrogenase